MPKAGRYEYPARDLDSCISYLKGGHEKLKSFVASREGFAGALGLSPRTGPFGVLVGAMGIYGLVDTGDGNIRYSELAKSILFGTPDEQAAAKKEAIRRITLFVDLHTRFGRDVSEDQIKLYLREAAGVDIAEAQEKAQEVSKIYKKVSSYLDSALGAGEQKLLRSEGESEMEEDVNKTPYGQQSGMEIASTSGIEKFESSDFGVWVKRDIDSIDFLKKQIEAWLDYVKSKVTKEQPQTTTN
jgi:hypothetical protein